MFSGYQGIYKVQKDWVEDKIEAAGASLVMQWLGIHLPMQGTWVQALVWEDLTCHGATGPLCHNC